MALCATRLASSTGSHPREHFQAGQLRANAFVRLPTVKRAIAALAAALMELPIMGGPEAEAILSQFLERGELAAMEANDAFENPRRNGGHDRR
jgi:hypothetical protein